MEPDQYKLFCFTLTSAIFGTELSRLHNMMGEIQDTHSLRHGSRAFLLDGKPIWNGDAVAAKTKNKKPLDSDLMDDARHINGLFTKLRSDMQRMTNFIGVMRNHCHTLQDFRDMLPDMVVEHMDMPEIRGLPRTRKAGYVFSSSPIKMKLYQDGVDIILHYLGNRLVF